MTRRLHLCCGPQILKDWINVDAINFGQQIVADLSKPWDFITEGTVDHIDCKDGFEHMPSAEHFLEQAARVLRPGGTLTIWVPHYKNPSAYRLTHLRLLSWSFFNVFPEPHDRVQNLEIASNRIYVGSRYSKLFKPFHALINLNPKWWERLFYVSNIEVTFRRKAG